MAEDIVPDGPVLRAGRRERAIAQMDAHGLDVLVLGRQANVRYVTGAPQLWVAGTRPFAPICVLVRATGDIHLNSTWDEGIPEEIGHEHLYGLAWNPMTIIEVLKGIEGAADAKRVGTDAMSPSFARLLPMAFPRAEFVDAEVAMKAARRTKTAEEIEVLRGALAVAERGLAAAVFELAVGMTEQGLNGVLMEAMTAGGYSTSATQDGAWITSPEHAWRVGRRDRRIADGDLVAFAAGALADGYVGEVGRTWPVGGASDAPGVRALFRRSNALWERLVEVCRPGASAGGLLDAYDDAGEALPPIPVAHGLGLGFDPPVISPDLPRTVADERLDPGMVLAVSAYVWEPGVGAVFHRDAVLIGDDGPEVLTSSPAWAQAVSF